MYTCMYWNLSSNKYQPFSQSAVLDKPPFSPDYQATIKSYDVSNVCNILNLTFKGALASRKLYIQHDFRCQNAICLCRELILTWVSFGNFSFAATSPAPWALNYTSVLRCITFSGPGHLCQTQRPWKCLQLLVTSCFDASSSCNL